MKWNWSELVPKWVNWSISSEKDCDTVKGQRSRFYQFCLKSPRPGLTSASSCPGPCEFPGSFGEAVLRARPGCGRLAASPVGETGSACRPSWVWYLFPAPAVVTPLLSVWFRIKGSSWRENSLFQVESKTNNYQKCYKPQHLLTIW